MYKLCNKKNQLAACVLSLCWFSGASNAGVVIVNAKSPVTITKEEAAKIFLGKMKKFADGTTIIVVKNAADKELRKTFCEKVLGRSLQQTDIYWSQMLFTGKASPPKELNNPGEAKQFVAQTPGAITYVADDAVDASVLVVYKF